MRLASLSLQGFKSFGNRVTLEFAPGVTAVIGPNGSGKSNLVDALKWTSGGGRAREFRANDKTDLIFHGATGKRSVGLAEVEVELSHGTRTLKLYRSLSRDGTTRLRLDGRAARFIDVDEALTGSGLGRSGLSIIGQGEVSQVLMADPPKLLEYVAEVAGVARMSTRREQTLARLETALSHLDRLQDVILELEDRCGALATEASDAERHAALSAESLRLRFTAASARIETLRAETMALHKRQGELEAELAEGRERLRAQRERRDVTRVEHEAAEVAYRSALAEAELRRGDVRVAEERRHHALERQASVEKALRAARAEAERIEGSEPPTPPEEKVEPLLAAEAVLQDRQAALEASERDAHEAFERSSRDRDALRASLARSEHDHAMYEARRTSLQQQADDVEERLAALEDGVVEVDEAELETTFTTRRQEATEADAVLERARAHLVSAHERQAHAAAEATARERAAERQRAAFESRRGYAQGPRNALTSGIPGVLGSVADLLRVPARYERAIGAALGRRAEYIVVDTAETGRDVLRRVRELGGFVTVLPLDLLRSADRPTLASWLDRPGVVGAAGAVVDVGNAYAAVVEQMLGNTLLLTSLDAATALARAASSRPRMVSLEGDILEASGAMSGGRRSQQASVLGAAAELEEAEQAARATAEAATRALSDLRAAQDALKVAQAKAEQCRQALDAARQELSSARERGSARRGLMLDLQARRQTLGDALTGLRPPEAPVDPGVLERADEEANRASAALEQARAATIESQTEHALLRQRRLVLEERWRSHATAKSRYDDERVRAAALRTESGRLERALDDAVREVKETGAALEAAVAALPTGLEDVAARVEAARVGAAELERAMSQETDSQAARAEELQECKIQRARRDAALELAEEEVQGLPGGIERLDLSERVARQRLRETGEALERLGAVNHRAANDLRETRERKETLEVESVQATLAVTELQGTLERIDRETTARLGDAIDRLQTAFATHVKQLFGEDGHGDIEIEEDEQRPVGIRIRLRPPGKQTQSLHLLSVGERTMGALAFLFALMADGNGSQGLPIAVLDEVDAPLDEANIRRYCGFVRRLAERGTQFVLITHQKATFEVADVLWGVTTEQGVSRVFSIRREEAAALP